MGVQQQLPSPLSPTQQPARRLCHPRPQQQESRRAGGAACHSSAARPLPPTQPSGRPSRPWPPRPRSPAPPPKALHRPPPALPRGGRSPLPRPWAQTPSLGAAPPWPPSRPSRGSSAAASCASASSRCRRQPLLCRPRPRRLRWAPSSPAPRPCAPSSRRTRGSSHSPSPRRPRLSRRFCATAAIGTRTRRRQWGPPAARTTAQRA